MTFWCYPLQESGPSLSFEEARKICLKKIARPEDFACIQLVYGFSGELVHNLCTS